MEDSYNSQPSQAWSTCSSTVVDAEDEQFPRGLDACTSVLDELDPQDVVERIQEIVTSLLLLLAEDHLPSITFTSRQARHAALVPVDDVKQQDLNEPTSSTQPAQIAIRMQSVQQERSLTARKAESAYAYVRLFMVLDAAHEMLLAGQQITQRELYYRLLSPPLISTPAHVNDAIQDAVALLHVPRSSLGICCSSKGVAAGCLRVYDPAAGCWHDCGTMLDRQGLPIPGDIPLLQKYTLDATHAQCVLVIEKDAIFQRLVQARIFDHLPMVLLTAKGFPDLASRAFLHHLHTTHPSLPVYALVDWNPAGVSIALTYKYGSRNMGLESPRFAVPSLQWLGVHSRMLDGMDAKALQPLTPRDCSMAERMVQTLQGRHAAWAHELEVMLKDGCKADIEALYTVADRGAEVLPHVLLRALAQGFALA